MRRKRRRYRHAISTDLRDGIDRWMQHASSIATAAGGVGARVIGTTPDGREHHGVLASIVECLGFLVRADDGKLYLIRTEWERYNVADPGALRAELRAEVEGR